MRILRVVPRRPTFTSVRPRDQRHLFVIVLLAAVIAGAFILVLARIEVAVVKELLAILFPPLVALTAAGVNRTRDP